MKLRNTLLAATAMSLVASTTLLADSTLGMQSTRLQSMQMSNYMTADGHNIFFNPAAMADTQTGGFAELAAIPNGGNLGNDPVGNTAIGYAGAMVNLGTAGTVGAVLNRANTSGMVANNNIDFLYGIKLDAMKIGARLTYANDNANTTTGSTTNPRVAVDTLNYADATSGSTANENTTNGSDVTIQLGLNMAGFDATFAYGIYGTDNVNETSSTTNTFDTAIIASSVLTGTSVSNSTANVEGDGQSLLEFALAYTYDLNEQSYVRGYGVYQATDRSTTATNTSSTVGEAVNTAGNATGRSTTTTDSSTATTATNSAILLGAAYNLKPMDNVLLVVAAEYTNQGSEASSVTTVNGGHTFLENLVAPTSSNMTTATTGAGNEVVTTTGSNDISLIVGAEAYMTEKLAVRFGLRESIYNSVTSETTTDNKTTFTNDNAVTTGAAISGATSNTVSDNTAENETGNNTSAANVQLAVGLGYDVTKEISVDALINTMFFFQGPNFISGLDATDAGSAPVLNARLAVNYNF